jgi:hypothetical protein
MTSELDFRQIPKLVVLRSSCLRQLEVSGFRVFMTLSLHRFKIPEIRMFANLKLPGPGFPKIVNSLLLKNISQELR